MPHHHPTWHRVAALGLAAGIILVLLLLCLYRVLCPRNYGQPGGGPGRRRRGDLPCDDYGYAPPETEIVPLVLRGHLMVSVAWGLWGRLGPWTVLTPVLMFRVTRPQDIECLASDGMLLVSCCLAGHVCVWDAQTGDCLTRIPRPGYVPPFHALSPSPAPPPTPTIPCHPLPSFPAIPCHPTTVLTLPSWPPTSSRQRRDSGVSSVFEAQESWERLSDGGKGGPEELGDSPPLQHRPRGPLPPSLFGDQPDLSSLIDTNFSAQTRLSEPAQPEPRHRAGCGRTRDSPGYDFSRLVQQVYQEEGLAPIHSPALRPPSPGPALLQAPEDEAGSPSEKGSPCLAWAPSADGSIWSLELQGNLIVVGRSSGRLEVGRGTGGGQRGRPLGACGPSQPAGAHSFWACRYGMPSRACCTAAARRSPRASQPSSSWTKGEIARLPASTPDIPSPSWPGHTQRFESWLPFAGM